MSIAKFPHIVLLLLLFICTGNYASAQETIVLGQVFDAHDKSPLSNVNVYFKNTHNGIVTDDDGFFVLRTSGNETVVVFSSVGYKRKELVIRKGQTASINIELQQESALLQEVFVIPGANPALPLLSRVRANAAVNNFFKGQQAGLNYTEQNVAFLGNINKKNTARKLFDSMTAGSIATNDSSLFLPVFLNESAGSLIVGKTKTVKDETYNASDKMVQFVRNLLDRIDWKFSFYNNSVNVFGIDFLSPLASGSALYYNFYLTDSVQSISGKIYEIHFRSKNQKNQLLNGILKVDSASAALVAVRAELPLQSNVNFIQQLKINQEYKCSGGYLPDINEVYIRLNQNIIKDTTVANPVLLLKKVVHFTSDSSTANWHRNFAQTGFSKNEIETKMSSLDNSSFYKTAKWIAGTVMTGYMSAGVFDVGKIQQLVRLNDVEGLRLTLPVKTNERLMKSLSVGGYVGYGFKNKGLQYSGLAEYLLPLKSRNLMTLSYTKDFRRIDYNYDNFIAKESPLFSGDDDIENTLLSFASTAKLSRREDVEVILNSDLSGNVESFASFRSNRTYADQFVPVSHEGVQYASITQKSMQFALRFSFDEKVYDRHTQRIYIKNKRPVIYVGIAGGRSTTPDLSAYFGKLFMNIRQNYSFALGSFNYYLNAVYQTGSLPYLYLDYPTGNEGENYGFYKFSLMNHMEYAADRYAELHTELVTNGVLFNNIPFLKTLNFRELLTFKTVYGSLNTHHASLIDIPQGIYTYSRPYSEVGVGITNILSLFSIQSIWRLTDTHHPDVSPWALKGSIHITF